MVHGLVSQSGSKLISSEGFSARIPSAHSWTSPLPYYWRILRYFEEGFLLYLMKGFSKGNKKDYNLNL